MPQPDSSGFHHWSLKLVPSYACDGAAAQNAAKATPACQQALGAVQTGVGLQAGRGLGWLPRRVRARWRRARTGRR